MFVPRQQRRRNRSAHARLFQSGFARQELMILLGACTILITIIGCGTWIIVRHRQWSAVWYDLQYLVATASRFYEENGVWPTENSGAYGDFRYGVEHDNAGVINVLRAIDGEGNQGHSVNPKRLIYFESERAEGGASGLDADGSFVDPWGHQYQIVLDTDLDDSCEMEGSIYDRRTGEGIAAWSLGRDGVSGTGDDILSWKR